MLSRLLLSFILLFAAPALAGVCLEDLSVPPFWTATFNDSNGDPYLSTGETFDGVVRAAHMGSVATGETCFASPCPSPYPALGVGYSTGDVWVHQHSGAPTWPLSIATGDPFANSASSSKPFIYSPEPGDHLFNGVGYDSWAVAGSFYYGGFAALFENDHDLVRVTLDRMHDTEPGKIRITTLHPDETTSEWLEDASNLPHMAPVSIDLQNVEGFMVDSKVDRARFSVRQICAYLDTDGDGYENQCDGDFNNDGTVNATDGSLLLEDLGGTDSGIGTDMNGDGTVNSTDGELFLAQLGGAPCD